MAQLLFLRGARQLLTLRGLSGVRRGPALHDLGIIEDGSVLIRDGLIDAVGPTRRIENLKEARGALEIPVDDSVVMPGFVDPNIQLSLEQPATVSGRPPKRRRLADFYSDTLTLMRSCLQHGTLNVQVKANAGGSELHPDLAVLRQLAKLERSPVGMVRAWRLGKSSRLSSEASGRDRLREMLPGIKHRALAQFVEIEPQLDEEHYERILPAVADSSLGVHLSWPGGSVGVLQAFLESAKGATQRVPPRRQTAKELASPLGGALEAATVLRGFLNSLQVHAVFAHHDLSEAECQVLIDSRAIVVFSLSKQLLEEAPGDCAKRLVEHGAAIALASGYDSYSAPTFSMQMVLALAETRLKLTPEQAISAATINAAHAIGRADQIGTLEVGKKADLLVLNLPDYREISRRLGMNHVGMAIREGNIAFNRTRWRASTA